ncbi:MAG: glycoside hydrolase family 65 protein [Bacteroides sp.]|nr:glycoside hydrolase family 65 protein [Bacteroides sp.]MCM1413380.1 glycoside hydrolase family 65 protein [Bacteroides sp.]MCM1471934.1 glycoside hydrolase family 65 protein [Bacteroides sp.]
MKLWVSFILLMAMLVQVAQANDLWHLTSDDPAKASPPPALGNGQIGILVDSTGMRPKRFFHSMVHSDGIRGQVSSIRESLIPLSLQVNTKRNDKIEDWQQTLMLDSACVVTSWRQGAVRFTSTMWALRQMPDMMMIHLTVEATGSADVTVVELPIIPDWLSDASIEESTIWCDGEGVRVVRSEAVYNDGRDRLAGSSAMKPIEGAWTRHGSDSLSIVLKTGQRASMYAVGAVCSSVEFSDPYNEADRQVIYALHQGYDRLLRQHNGAWHKLWQSRVEIDGDDDLSRLVNASLYNLYSSIRAGSRRSIAPMGLTSDKYYGHIFWDADTWIFPVLAVLHPDLAKSMIDYRFDGLEAARCKARAYGYDGAMYPWEADLRGEESTPTFALTGPMEHHVTADVARAAWLYYCATADTAWLREEGYPILRSCADFWISRLSPTDDGTDRLTVKNVVGADEYAIGVDGNAFTNGAARRALEHAADAADILGVTPDTRWRDFAGRIILHTLADDPTIVLEHKDYNGAMTKQADVELLAYPLEIMTDPEQIKRNIEYYSDKIDPVGGPAMSHAAMAVNYVDMDEPQKAAELIRRATEPYLRGPFLSFSETPGNDETYFVTAAGGLLQAVIFGYGGMRITGKGVEHRKVSLPEPIKSVRVIVDGM